MPRARRPGDKAVDNGSLPAIREPLQDLRYIESGIGVSRAADPVRYIPQALQGQHVRYRLHCPHPPVRVDGPQNPERLVRQFWADYRRERDHGARPGFYMGNAVGHVQAALADLITVLWW